MKVELYLIPIAAFHDKLHFYVTPNSEKESLRFPVSLLGDELHVEEATRNILRRCFSCDNDPEFENWLLSSHCAPRIINVFDRPSLPEKEKSIAIVRAISICENLAMRSKDNWQCASSLLESSSMLSIDNQVFLNEALNLIPMWVKSTSFTFELMSQVFSIQDLRLLVSMLSNQEIDAGNFHRRLKKLDILRPQGSSQQRVHRWEFAWERSPVLSADGLIP